MPFALLTHCEPFDPLSRTKKRLVPFYWYSLRESNPQRPLRRGLLYPFNYGSKCFISFKDAFYYTLFFCKKQSFSACFSFLNIKKKKCINISKTYKQYKISLFFKKKLWKLSIKFISFSILAVQILAKR